MAFRHQAFVSSSLFPSSAARRRHTHPPGLASRRVALPSPQPTRRAKRTPSRPHCMLRDFHSDERDEIIELDNSERRRRKQDTHTSKQLLTAEEEAAVLDRVPGLRELVAKIDEKVAADPLDPDDWRIYSHIAKLLRPRRLPLALKLVLAVALCIALRAAALAIRAQFSPGQVLAFFLDVEQILQPVVLVAALLQLLFVCLRHRGMPHVDAVVRSLLMYSLSTLALMPVAAMAATSNAALALGTGVFARVAMQLPALCMWVDLRGELFYKRDMVGHLFRAWRFVAVALLACPGILARGLGLVGALPALVAAVAERASALRVRAGARFPVALSLCNDPRGLFLLACIAFCFALAHLVNLVVFVSPFLRKRRHRECESWLTAAFVRAGIYLPNVHPDEALLRSTTPDGTKPYFASRAMMLRHEDSVFELDSAYLSTEASLPIFTHLDKEKDILARENADYWIRPREEELPFTDTGVDVDKAIEMLESWARPLSAEQEDTGFSEFFETLTDEEYQYDGNKGEWVFDDEAVARNAAAAATDSSDGAGVQTTFDSGSFARNLEFIGPQGDDSMAVAVPAELEPWLQQFVEDGDFTGSAEDIPKELEPWLENIAKNLASGNVDEIPKELEPWLQKFVEDGEDEDDANEPPVTVFV